MIPHRDSGPGGRQLVRELPDFTNPPLVEVVLSIQFAALPALRSAQIGLLWQQLRSEYPQVTEQPVLAPTFETFGTPPRAQVPFQIEALLSPPLPRFWFEKPDAPDLLQIQQDRIIHNWRRQSDNSRAYPRYGSVKAAFVREVKIFTDWLVSEKMGEIRPNQCEVIYTNIIDVGADETYSDFMRKLTPLWAGKYVSQPPNILEDANLQLRFMFPKDDKPTGRLYVQLQAAVRQDTGARVVKLELTARGRPKGETVADAFELLDEERVQIVKTFASVTTTNMHKIWRRTDA
jgi:uncharacterized protein (TIGR04255 family)